jgi:hypothetical protein
MKTWIAEIAWETPDGGQAVSRSTIEARNETSAKRKAGELAKGCGPVAKGKRRKVDVQEIEPEDA